MTKRKVMLRTPKDVTPVSLINSLTCFFAALNQIGATSPNSFLPQNVLAYDSGLIFLSLIDLLFLMIQYGYD